MAGRHIRVVSIPRVIDQMLARRVLYDPSMLFCRPGEVMMMPAIGSRECHRQRLDGQHRKGKPGVGSPAILRFYSILKCPKMFVEDLVSGLVVLSQGQASEANG